MLEQEEAPDDGGLFSGWGDTSLGAASAMHLKLVDVFSHVKPLNCDPGYSSQKPRCHQHESGDSTEESKAAARHPASK